MNNIENGGRYMLKSMVSKLLFGILMLGGMSLAYAAPFTLDKNIKPLELKFSQVPDHPRSLWTGANGALGDAPHYIAVGGMTPQRMQIATLFALGEGSVTMTVVKNTWDENLKSCTSKAGESCDVDFRAFGDASFKITGDKGAAYRFVLLAGPEHDADEVLPSPLYTVSKEKINSMPKGGVTEATPSSDTDSFHLIVIGLLVALVLIVLAGVIIMGRKKPTLQSLILLVFISATFIPYTSHAQDDDPAPLPPGAYNPGNISPDGSGGGEKPPTPFDTAHALEAIKAVAPKLAIVEMAKKLDEVWLGKCDRIGNPERTPQIPSLCSGDRACEACYSDARGNFNEVRAKLEKLRLIYSCSQSYSKAAIAFGDSSSGIHAVVGLVWQDQKFEILKSVRGLQAAYDDMYTKLINELHESMIKMGTCEQKFGAEDWYDRFGYVYYEFMSDKYKRAD